VLGPIEAQQRMDRIRAFEAERDALRDAGVLSLTDEQAASVQRYHSGLRAELTAVHELDTDAAERRLSLGLRVASLIGALSMAASLYLLLERYLDELPRGLAVSLLVLLPIATALGTWMLQRYERSGYIARLVALVSFAAFVYDLNGLASLYGITPSDRALLAYGGYATLLAYATRSTLLVAASVLAFDCYIAMRAGTLGGGYWLYFGEHPENFFPAAIALLALPEIVDVRTFGFSNHYRVWGIMTLLLPILVLANVGELSYLSAAPHAIEVGYQIAGFGLSALAIWAGARRDQMPVVNTGVTFFVIFLYTKFYDWWWATLPKYLFFLIIGLTAVLVVGVLRAARRRHTRVVGGGL
jgi:uncharacterized membrane protein